MAKDKLTIIAPCDGEIIKIEDVTDPIFSNKLIGDGFAIIPTDNNFVVPISGKMATVFDTKHAYVIKNDIIEILVHIGLDTFNLNEQIFESFVNQGDDVSQGDKMCKINMDLSQNKAQSMQTPIIITNKASFKIVKTGTVKSGEVVAEVK